MENGGLDRGKITAEDVISKLKDDGDYDRLRLKIIRKLKDNEELRSSIMSTVRQSEALNRPNAKKMKPRQLSDAIYQEVGTKVMSEISDSLWTVIKSGDGMKNEITETVQSVYNKLLNPNASEDGQTSSGANLQSVQKGPDSNGNTTSTPREVNGTPSERVTNPDSPRLDLGRKRKNKRKEPEMPTTHDSKAKEACKSETHSSSHRLGPNEEDTNASPPGFSIPVDHNQPGDGSDEDPDVPPGFG